MSHQRFSTRAELTEQMLMWYFLLPWTTLLPVLLLFCYYYFDCSVRGHPIYNSTYTRCCLHMQPAHDVCDGIGARRLKAVQRSSINFLERIRCLRRKVLSQTLSMVISNKNQRAYLASRFVALTCNVQCWAITMHKSRGQTLKRFRAWLMFASAAVTQTEWCSYIGCCLHMQ